MDNDSVIPIRGQGEPGENGGPNGDLYVVITVKPHKIFKRDRDNLYLDIPITFNQAALGDEITVRPWTERYPIRCLREPSRTRSSASKGRACATCVTAAWAISM